jgi:hypothetical protein
MFSQNLKKYEFLVLIEDVSVFFFCEIKRVFYGPMPIIIEMKHPALYSENKFAIFSFFGTFLCHP